ncbi:MAG: hypothetical protein ACJAWH_000158 [Maribacter sp.]|jgi:hypothetical protein
MHDEIEYDVPLDILNRKVPFEIFYEVVENKGGQSGQIPMGSGF